MADYSKIRPVKFLGQNFLRDKNIVRKIVDEINPAEDDCLIEIGPGTGALTEELIKRVKKLTAVEIDFRTAAELKREYSDLHLIEADFVKLPIEQLTEQCSKPLRFAGNIPYSITSPILFKFLENKDVVLDAVLMVQYEVARRMTADMGTKEYGILAVLLNTFASVKLCFKVSPNVFYPRPKVYSAVVHLHFDKSTAEIEDTAYYITLVKSAFSKRRKKFSNSLAGTAFDFLRHYDTPVDFALRPEQISIEGYKELYRFAKTKKETFGD
jgi:16S rRNA (adenine1518-N6/adenine1519-N6)-dimethyltransferase